MSFYVSLSLPDCLSLPLCFLYVSLSLYVSDTFSMYLCLLVSLCLFLYLSVHLSVSVSVSLCLSMSLHVYLCLCMSLPISPYLCLYLSPSRHSESSKPSCFLQWTQLSPATWGGGNKMMTLLLILPEHQPLYVTPHWGINGVLPPFLTSASSYPHASVSPSIW